MQAPPPPSALLGLDEALLLLTHRLHLCVGWVTRTPAKLHGRPPAWASLNEEEAGCRGRVMVDVHGDQHPGNHDEHHQEDAEDQTDVQRVCTWHPVHSTVCRHYLVVSEMQRDLSVIFGGDAGGWVGGGGCVPACCGLFALGCRFGDDRGGEGVQIRGVDDVAHLVLGLIWAAVVHPVLPMTVKTTGTSVEAMAPTTVEVDLRGDAGAAAGELETSG